MDDKLISEIVLQVHMDSRVIARFFDNRICFQKQNKAFRAAGGDKVTMYWRDTLKEIPVAMNQFEDVIREFERVKKALVLK